MGKCQKFGLGGSPKITKGGKGQINRQGTRAGSILGEQKEVPNVNLNKYIGMKAGGMTHDDIKEDKKLIKKAFTMHDDQLHEGKRTNLSKLKKGGKVKKMAMGGTASARADGIASKGKTKGKWC